MTTPEPGRLARLLVTTAVRMLPAAHRDRYRQELRSELGELPRAEQRGYAVRVLLRSVALRGALRAPGAVDVAGEVVLAAPNRPLTCRMHLYHRWKTFTTDDGERYVGCSRCGTVKEGSGDTIGYIAPAGF
jgi:hypothetical protein